MSDYVALLEFASLLPHRDMWIHLDIIWLFLLVIHVLDLGKYNIPVHDSHFYFSAVSRTTGNMRITDLFQVNFLFHTIKVTNVKDTASQLFRDSCDTFRIHASWVYKQRVELEDVCTTTIDGTTDHYYKVYDTVSMISASSFKSRISIRLIIYSILSCYQSNHIIMQPRSTVWYSCWHLIHYHSRNLTTSQC